MSPVNQRLSVGFSSYRQTEALQVKGLGEALHEAIANHVDFLVSEVRRHGFTHSFVGFNNPIKRLSIPSQPPVSALHLKLNIGALFF